MYLSYLSHDSDGHKRKFTQSDDAIKISLALFSE
jgi:hypothetical protein